MSENEVIVKAIGELLGMHFYIPSYQRGYRWTAQQINDLLGDIATFGQQCQRGEGEAGFYCLQPLRLGYSFHLQGETILLAERRPCLPSER